MVSIELFITINNSHIEIERSLRTMTIEKELILNTIIELIQTKEDVNCYCPDCKNFVAMTFDSDYIGGSGDGDEYYWSHFKCPLCCQYYDVTGRYKHTDKDLINYNTEKLTK
jgi:transposase-like protein